MPEGLSASDVAVKYYYGTGSEAGWYPAKNVEGWLVPDSYLELELDGMAYLGFLVRHGRTAQLVMPVLEPVATTASVIPNDAIVLALAAAALLWVGRRVPRRRH